jgi:carotenoid cleavage dioxygenase-like enzyme
MSRKRMTRRCEAGERHPPAVRMRSRNAIRDIPMRSILLLACLAAAALGCSGSPVDLDPNSERELGFLEYHGTPVEITVPATAKAGVPFTVRVATWGGGCTAKGDTEVSVSGSTANVRPYDITATGRAAVCTDILRTLMHETTVRFDTPGTATVRVHGRVEPGSRTVVLTRTVTVQAN